MKLEAGQLKNIAWSLSGAVSLLALIVWWQGYKGQINNIYQVFPLFGLLAFSLMWTHYIAAALRMSSGLDKSMLKTYFDVTSVAVLAAILLHPALLGWQLWRDGAGLPPASELNYVGESIRIFVVFGMVSWLVFLAYEFHQKYGERSWWKHVQYASDLAMLLVFVHGLRLGSHLQSGWFQKVWVFYGVSLVIAIVYMNIKNAKKT